jgi:hypothetical protein
MMHYLHSNIYKRVEERFIVRQFNIHKTLGSISGTTKLKKSIARRVDFEHSYQKTEKLLR